MNENQVIAALKKHLLTCQYTEVSECSTIERGVDLVMRTSAREIRIEAKGSTSSKKNSPRYGKEFTDSQCYDLFSRALFKACQMRDEALHERSGALIAMALGHTKNYQKYCDRTTRTRRELGIGLFWVKAGGRIELAEEWEY